MDFCKEKRREVLNQMDDNSICILTSGPEIKESADDNYPFSVNRNFYYLTAIDEANVILVLVKGKKEEEILFIKAPDEKHSKWYPKTINKEEATLISSVQDVRYVDDLENNIERIVKDNKIEICYIDDENDPIIHFGQDIVDELEVFDEMEIDNIYPVIAKLRTTKEEYEINKIKEAIEVTRLGIENMMKNSKPKMMEYELEAYYNFVLDMKQLPISFKTIIGSGINGTVLHYSTNNCEMKDNTLVLCDLGVAKNRYCSDITRTFPVNGKFTDKQKMVYQIVLNANKLVEKSAKPGVSIKQLDDMVVEYYQKELKGIGLIKEGTKEEVNKYYWHSISHQLGLDVHDVGYKKYESLKEGMIITNEPGLYIAEWEIGIRIEDDLLITKDGCENLSKGIMKEIDEIENFMNG